MLLTVLFMLLVGHAMMDFSWQSDTIAIGKSRHPDPAYRGVPWYYWMTAHALGHGGMVSVLTGSVYLGVAETFLHWIIDALKCEKYTSIHTDQALHVLCKILWAAILVSSMR